MILIIPFILGTMAALFGYFDNIYKLYLEVFHTVGITGLEAFRAIGLFIPPIGIFLGYV